MIDGLKPYPEYKESGRAWLGSVPRHWPVLPNRAVFAEVKDRGHADEEMLSVTITRGIVPQEALLSDSSKKDSSRLDRSAYKLVQPRDIAYNKMRAWQGAIAVSDLRGIISPAYIVMRLREEQNARYFHHLYRTPQFAKEAERWSYGITSDMWSLRPEHFRMIYSARPPRDEQDAIVRFLDHADRRIEQAIGAKKKLIALLHEQKQAIIHRAVTRGLDPDVPLKPSGIPWLGDIPKHWEVQRNSQLFDERIERGRNGLPILVVSLRTGVTEGSDTNEDGREKRLIADVRGYKFTDQGDIAYNTMRMWQGAVGVVPKAGMVSPAYVVAKPRREVFSAYYELLFRTDGCKNEINRNSRGIVSDRNRLYWDQFKRLFLPLPPLEEQKQIVSYIVAETKTLTTAIGRTEREIVLLREYRTRLVADVVTGKLDVRDAARDLPVDSMEQSESVPDESEETELIKEEQIA